MLLILQFGLSHLMMNLNRQAAHPGHLILSIAIMNEIKLPQMMRITQLMSAMIILEIRLLMIMDRGTGETGQYIHCLHCFGASFLINRVVSHLGGAGHMKPMQLVADPKTALIKMNRIAGLEPLFNGLLKRLDLLGALPG